MTAYKRYEAYEKKLLKKYTCQGKGSFHENELTDIERATLNALREKAKKGE